MDQRHPGTTIYDSSFNKLGQGELAWTKINKGVHKVGDHARKGNAQTQIEAVILLVLSRDGSC